MSVGSTKSGYSHFPFKDVTAAGEICNRQVVVDMEEKEYNCDK